MKEIEAFTDGSCLGNPGAGGWASIVRYKEHEKILSGGYKRTTNNRMELIAVIEALKLLIEPCVVTVYSDSSYVCDSVKKGWLTSWQKKNWINSAKKPVKNRDLWEEMVPLLKKHKVTMQWIRGHDGHVENERCDELARAAASGSSLQEDSGFIE